MADEINQPGVVHYKGEEYETTRNRVTGFMNHRDDYIRFNWSTGYLQMRMYDFEKLKKSQKDMLYNLALGIESKPKKSKKKKSPNLGV